MRSERSDMTDLPQVQFLTVAEVAARMRVSKMTVYRLVHAGELPAARVGRTPARRLVRRGMTVRGIRGGAGARTVGRRR